MTPKKRTVDKNMVKYDLAIGKHPGEIAKEWGVSRQYISSIRQELVKERSLQKGKPGRPVKSTLRKEGAKFDWSDMSDIMVALDSKACILDAQVLTYRARRGRQIRSKAFTRQFAGKCPGDAVEVRLAVRESLLET